MIPGGYNHSGRYGQINFLQGVMGLANAQRALNYIRIITEFISQPEWRNVVPFFGILNEPIMPRIGYSQLQSLCVDHDSFILPFAHQKPHRYFQLRRSASLDQKHHRIWRRKWPLHRHPRWLHRARSLGGLHAWCGSRRSGLTPVLRFRRRARERSHRNWHRRWGRRRLAGKGVPKLEPPAWDCVRICLKS